MSPSLVAAVTLDVPDLPCRFRLGRQAPATPRGGVSDGPVSRRMLTRYDIPNQTVRIWRRSLAQFCTVARVSRDTPRPATTPRA